MPAPRRPRYASDPPALSPQTSLSLPSESDDGRVRSAEVKDGHLLPALDASYGRGSNELEHPLVEAYRSECSGKESQNSPLRDAYVAASPPKNEQVPPALIMKSMASPELPRPQFSPEDRATKRKLARMLRGPLGRFAPPKSHYEVAKGPGTVIQGGTLDLRVFKGGYATPSGTKRGVTPPSALVVNHDRPVSPNAFLEFSACDTVENPDRAVTRHPPARAYDGSIAQRVGLAGVSPATVHCEHVARSPSVDLPLSAGKARMAYRDGTKNPELQARLDAVDAAARASRSRRKPEE